MIQTETRPLADRASILIELKRYDDAIALLHQALARDSSNCDVLCLLGLALLRSDQYESALESVERAIQADPEEEWGHRLRGVALGCLHRRREAVQAAMESVRLAPHNSYGLYN